MTKKVKLFMVDEKPYLVSLDTLEIGDKAIVTVGGKYPSVVVCENEQILNLITDSKLTLTQTYKVYSEPQKGELTQKQIDVLEEGDGVLEVEVIDGVANYII
jgi:hypothetical protein